MKLTDIPDMESLRSLCPFEFIARIAANRHNSILGLHHCFSARNNRNCISTLLSNANTIRNDFCRNHRSDSIMNQNDIFWIVMLFKFIHTVTNRILTILSSWNYILQLRNIKLICICPENRLPTFDTNHSNLVNLRMLLKSLKSIDNNRLIIHIDKLFRYILAHTSTNTASDD